MSMDKQCSPLVSRGVVTLFLSPAVFYLLDLTSMWEKPTREFHCHIGYVNDPVRSSFFFHILPWKGLPPNIWFRGRWEASRLIHNKQVTRPTNLLSIMLPLPILRRCVESS